MDLTDKIRNGEIEITNGVRKLTIGGVTTDYKVHRIPLEFLYYNDKNDRIACSICKYISDNGNMPDIFNSDGTISETYNVLIDRFINDSNPNALRKTKDNIRLLGQIHPAVVLNDGRVIDGNRRFACLRLLSREQDAYYQNYAFIDAIVLDRDINRNSAQLKMLELQLQHGIDPQIDYDPIDKLVGLYNDVIENQILTDIQYYQSMGIQPAEFRKMKEQALLMVDFLDFINAHNKFYIARELNIYSSLVDLASKLRSLHSEEEKENMKNTVFYMLAMQNEDMTHSIRNYYRLSNQGKESFQQSISGDIMSMLEELPDDVDSLSLQQVRANHVEGVANASAVLSSIRQRETIRDERRRQIENISNALDSLRDCDNILIQNLSEDKKNEIKSILDKLETEIESIRNAIR